MLFLLLTLTEKCGDLFLNYRDIIDLVRYRDDHISYHTISHNS